MLAIIRMKGGINVVESQLNCSVSSTPAICKLPQSDDQLLAIFIFSHTFLLFLSPLSNTQPGEAPALASLYQACHGLVLKSSRKVIASKYLK